MKIVDLYLDVPETADYVLSSINGYMRQNEKASGYKYSFGVRLLRKYGFESWDQMERLLQTESRDGFDKIIQVAVNKLTMNLDQFVSYLDSLGVAWGATSVEDHDDQKTAALVKKYPDRFVGFTYSDPKRGMQAVRDLECSVREYGLGACYISAFRTHIPANDKRCYPVYAKCVELNIPVFIYTCMNLNPRLPMDIGHPRMVDEVARDFPELRIMATVGGFPWVHEFIGLAVRHANVYLNTEIHEPANFTIPGYGLEPLLAAGGRRVEDKMTFASNWASMGKPLKEVVDQFVALPLKDRVKEKWAYQNAERFFGRL